MKRNRQGKNILGGMGVEGKQRAVRVLLCSVQPWKDSLLSPEAPNGSSACL